MADFKAHSAPSCYLHLGGSANGRTNTCLYVHSSGSLARRGTSQTFCENKEPFPWLFTDDLQRISERFKHGWTEQLLRIQINGLKPCFFHKFCFGRWRNKICRRLTLSIGAVVRRKPCLISILPTCFLQIDSLSVIVVKSFLVFRFQLWSRGLWCVFWAEWSSCEQWSEDDCLHLYAICTGMCQSIRWIMHVSAPLIFPALIFISCVSSVGQSLIFQIFKGLQMYLLGWMYLLQWRIRSFFHSQAGSKSQHCPCLHPKELKTKSSVRCPVYSPSSELIR